MLGAVSRTVSLPSPLRFDFRTDKYGDELLIDVGSTRELPGFRFHRTPHQLTFYDVLLLRKGNGRLVQEDRWHSVSPGTVAFHAPGEHRRWLLTAGAEGLVLFFTEEFLRSFLQDAGFLGRLPFFVPGGPRTLELEPRQRSWLEERLLDMRSEVQGDAWGRVLALQAGCYEVLVRLARLHRRRRGDRRPAAAAPPWLARFVDAVDRDFRTERSVTHYAREAGVSPGHLSHLVRDRLGRSVGEVVRSRILLEARRALLHSDLSIREVAEECGFDDPSYFVKYFRRYVGETPGTYRERIARMCH